MGKFDNNTLLPHNNEAYLKVIEHFKNNNRAAVVHATGTGKSYIIAAVADKFPGKVIVLAPNYFVLGESRKLCSERIEFRTFASLMYDESPAGDYQLICIDEFHRAGAEEWGKGVARLLEANPNAKVLGTTATAIRYLDGQRNMADELFDGNVVSSLSLREAIDRDIIQEPTYVASLYAFKETYSAIKEQIMASNKKSEEDKMKAMRTLNGIAHNWENAHGVSLVMRKYLHKDIKRVVVFCSKVAKAAKARDILGPWFAGAGFKHIRFYNIDYKEKNVKKEMEDFQMDNFDGIKVAISVNMLNEGVHVDGVDAIVMMRSTVSPNIILQQIGRCLTAKKTEHKPVILDLVNNMDTLGTISKWAFAGSKIATGVRDDDNSMGKGFPFNIIDECRDIRMFLTQVQNEFDVVADNYPIFWKFIEENGRLPKSSVKEEVFLYAWCGYIWRNDRNLAEKYPDVYEKLKEMRFGEGTDVQTEKRVQKFFEFVNAHKRLPKISVKEEKSLYEWCQDVWRNVRGLADRCPEVLAKLKEMRWGEGKDVRTEKTVERFFEFVNTHGRLPNLSSEEKRLYFWCRNVWKNRNGIADRFPEALAKLKELRWGETKNIHNENRETDFFDFVEKNGRLPKGSDKDEKSLWSWCGQVWRNQNGLADRFPEVLTKLKEMRFGETADLQTEKRVQEFFEFVSTHGRLPKYSILKEKNLYGWCGEVWRNKYGLADRCPEVLAKLKEMKWGKVYNTKSEERVSEFLKFVEKHGRLPKKNVPEEKRLFQWCRNVWSNQNGIADRFPHVVAKIKEMRFGESVYIHNENRKTDFFDFVEKHGRLPKSSVKEEVSLYKWCAKIWRNVRGLAEKYPDVHAKIKELKG